MLTGTSFASLAYYGRYFPGTREKSAAVFSRGAATECSPGRKPVVGVGLERSPGRAKDCEDSFAPPGLRSFRKKTPGSRPGLHSVAAPRLAQSCIIRMRWFSLSPM